MKPASSRAIAVQGLPCSFLPLELKRAIARGQADSLAFQAISRIRGVVRVQLVELVLTDTGRHAGKSKALAPALADAHIAGLVIAPAAHRVAGWNARGDLGA